jgi:hypothetical protein
MEEAPPDTEGQQPLPAAAEPTPTDLRRNVWLLVVVLGVVALAWAASLAARAVSAPPETVQEAQSQAPAPGAAPAVPAVLPPVVVQPMRVVGTHRTVIPASPPEQVAPGGPVYRRARLFDVTDAAPGFDLGLVTRIGSRWADDLPNLDASDLAPGSFCAAGSADGLSDTDRVVQVLVAGCQRGYPVNVLRVHGLIRDVIAGSTILVGWSPYAQAACCLAWPEGTEVPQLSDSGLTYRAANLYYDAADGSLWDALSGEVLTGPRAGSRADLPLTRVWPWPALRESEPECLVLTAEGLRSTAPGIDEAYLRSPTVPFPTAHYERGTSPLPAKAFVMGVRVDGLARAYPLASVLALEEHTASDTLAGQPITVHALSQRTGYVEPAEGLQETSTMLWFAWLEANPSTDVYSLPEGGAPGAG